MNSTKSIFKLKQEFNEINHTSTIHINRVFETLNDANKKLNKFEIKLLDKQMAFVGTNQLIKEALKRFKQGEIKYSDQDMQNVVDRVSKIEFVDTYSKYNIFVWIKRYHRLYEELSRKIHVQMRYSHSLLSRLKQLDKDLYSYRHNTQVKEMCSRINVLREDLLTSTRFKLDMYDCYNLMEQVLMFDPVINKNNFLSLITIRKEKDTISTINALPNELDIEDIRNAIFVEMIEDNSETYYLDFMMEAIFKLRDANPKLKKEMDERIGIDMIPTVSVSFDEYGEVDSIKQNPPNLKLV